MSNTSPQTENGFTRIANELLDAIISFPLSKREYSIVLTVIRYTYGYNRKEDAISGWQFSEITGIDRSHVSKTLSDLYEKNILIKSDRCRISHGQEIPFIYLNKHYDQWLTVAETATVAKTAPVPKQPHTVAETATETVAETAIEPLLKQPTHKDSTKDNKDKPKRQYAPPIDDALLSDWLAVRKAKKAGPVTETAWKGILREAEKARITPEQAVQICCERGWQGFNAEWYAKLSRSTQGGFDSKNYGTGGKL